MTLYEFRKLVERDQVISASLALWAADEIDRLNARVADLECFTAELWCVDRANAQSTAQNPDDAELAAWARGLLEEAARLGIDDLAAALEVT